MKPKPLIYVLFFSALVCDFVLKEIFVRYSFASSWISFYLVKNTGAAFGIFKDLNWFFIILSIVALGIIAYYFGKQKQSAQILLSLVSAGIVGNLLNRIMYGYVIDFVDLGWWPVFNLADLLISVGVILLVVLLRKSS